MPTHGHRALDRTQDRRWCVLVLVSSVVVAAAARGDWPHLRGPNYDGVATEPGLAETWPTEGPPRLWECELGQGHSGFVVGAGRLYTQRQDQGGQFVLCLDPHSGAVLWETRCDWAWQPRGAYPGPYATPTYAGGKVYYATPGGLVGCIDAVTGTPRWSLDLRAKFQGKGWEFGYAATPLVEDGRVIMPVGGAAASIVALDAEDGHVVWTSGSEPASYCPAMPITFGGRRCVVGYLQNAVVIVELATGQRLYHQSLSSAYDEHSAWPLYREPHLLLTAPFRAPAACLTLETGSGGALETRPRWTSRELSNDVVSSVLYRDHVYGFDLRQLQTSPHRPSRGAFKCLDWATGKVAWSTDEVGHAALLVADDKLLLLDDTGNLVLARADPAAYQELARVALFPDELCWTPPTLWQGRLFVRSPSRAVCLWLGRTDQASPATVPVTRRQSWRLHGSWLLQRERDYPNDAPSWEEMTLWYLACLGVLGAALATAVLPRRFGRRTTWYWAAVFALGLLGPNVVSALADRCVFTWPVSLYAAFHLALLTCAWAEHHPHRRQARWRARLAVVGLLGVAWLYFEACKLIGMFIAWSFLIGLLPAFPFAWLAVRTGLKPLPRTLWSLVAFSTYFWSCQALFAWQEYSATP